MFAILLVMNALAALRWRRPGGRLLSAAAALALFFYCWPPVSMLLVRAVESRYSRVPPADTRAGAMVVLAGAIHDPFPPLPTILLGDNTDQRCRYAAWLHARLPGLPVLVSGDSSRAMHDLLRALGIPGELLWTEDRSRNTYENALYSAALLRARNIRRVILVTDALHMPRARRCFEKQGIEIVPAPCSFHPAYEFGREDLLPGWTAVRWNEDLLHELAGMAWYRLRGRL